MRFISCGLLAILCIMPLATQETANTPGGISAAGEASLAVSTELAMQLELEGDITYRADFGSLGLSPSLKVTPVTLAGGMELAYSLPEPFLRVFAGITFGSGWPLADLANGIGTETASGTYTRQAFGQLMTAVDLGATLQFDLAEVLPGDWNHLVVQSRHAFRYAWLGGVSDATVWEFEAEPNQRNGWSYQTESLLAYRMPAMLDMVGIQLKTKTMPGNSADSPVASGGWGSDYVRWTPGILISLSPAEWLSFVLLAEWKTMPAWAAGNASLPLYQRRIDPKAIHVINPMPEIFLMASIKFGDQE